MIEIIYDMMPMLFFMVGYLYSTVINKIKDIVSYKVRWLINCYDMLIDSKELGYGISGIQKPIKWEDGIIKINREELDLTDNSERTEVFLTVYCRHATVICNINKLLRSPYILFMSRKAFLKLQKLRNNIKLDALGVWHLLDIDFLSKEDKKYLNITLKT